MKYDVGGIMMDRPFKMTRLGHFGFDNVQFEDSVRFYTDDLGFRISDSMDHKLFTRKPEIFDGLGDTNGYFMRHGGDHHSMALFNRRVREALARTEPNPEIVTNQITFQVSTLREIVEAHHWFIERGVKMQRAGRDMRGSNWHTYLYDPDGHAVELYYGIEQIGWDGNSKPLDTVSRSFHKIADIPQISELTEIQQALEKGVDLAGGRRGTDRQDGSFEVGGVLLPRPFKISKIGPIRIFVNDVEVSLNFYRDIIGLTLTEEVIWQGHRCVFLRANTEHHSLALYPLAMRPLLDLDIRSTCLSFGVQLGSYRQLRDALPYLQGRGRKIVELPAVLRPGIDYAAYVLDPDGHPIELHYYMEQVGWDGRPRTQQERRQVTATSWKDWPETLEPLSDTYMGEQLLGPIG